MLPENRPPATPGPITLLVWLNALGVTVLVGTELVMLSLSLDWAVAGIFHLGRTLAYGLLAALIAASAWACWQLFRRAVVAERETIAASEG